MATSRVLSKQLTISIVQRRFLLRPPKNLPIRGIYRTEGETVRKDEILVCQQTFNYHPGLNVYYTNDRGENLLKAHCDGTVRITTEEVIPNMTCPEMSIYVHKSDIRLKKLTFNVIPQPMSQTFVKFSEV